MARNFVFPQNLQALEEQEDEEHDGNRLYAQNPISITSMHPSELVEFVKGQSLTSLPISFLLVKFPSPWFVSEIKIFLAVLFARSNFDSFFARIIRIHTHTLICCFCKSTQSFPLE